jgi:hypothetical protein
MRKTINYKIKGIKSRSGEAILLRFCTLIVLTITSANIVSAGNVLTAKSNLIRPGDRLDMMKLKTWDVGESGRDITWQLNDVQAPSGAYSISYSIDTLQFYHKEEPGRIYYYKYADSKLLLMENEDRLYKIKFSKPILSMSFPFKYGETLTSTFLGCGTYCCNHFVNVSGQVYQSADATGSMVINETDTIGDILRVYTLTSASIAMDMDTNAIDTTHLRQQIEERYDWYAKGYRYPIITSITRTCFTNLHMVATSSSSYCILPQDFKIKDVLKDSLRDSFIKDRQKHNPETPCIKYNVTKEANSINVSLNSPRDQNVSALLSSSMGVVFERHSCKVSKSESCIIRFNTESLLPGQYVIYINAAGKIYTYKFNMSYGY